MTFPPLGSRQVFTPYTIFRKADGAISRRYRGPAPELQVGADEDFIEGDYPSEGVRINPQTRLAEAFVPASPPGYEWDVAIAQHVPTAREKARRDARRQIDALEGKQARALREQAIGRGGTPTELKQRLEDIDDQITALRADLGSEAAL